VPILMQSVTAKLTITKMKQLLQICLVDHQLVAIGVAGMTIFVTSDSCFNDGNKKDSHSSSGIASGQLQLSESLPPYVQAQ